MELFSRLPPEIRLDIWEFALAQPHVVDLGCRWPTDAERRAARLLMTTTAAPTPAAESSLAATAGPVLTPTPHAAATPWSGPRALAQTCRESRAVFHRLGSGVLPLGAIVPGYPTVYLAPSTILYIGDGRTAPYFLRRLKHLPNQSSLGHPLPLQQLPPIRNLVLAAPYFGEPTRSSEPFRAITGALPFLETLVWEREPVFIRRDEPLTLERRRTYESACFPPAGDLREEQRRAECSVHVPDGLPPGERQRLEEEGLRRWWSAGSDGISTDLQRSASWRFGDEPPTMRFVFSTRSGSRG